MHIVGVSGSLRKGSFNSGLLRYAQTVVPQGHELEIFSIANIPLFNQDIEKPPPPPVQAFKDAVKAADAVLFVTPEYNYSTSGVLKNAIDWLSRPYGDNSLEGKPVAVMGAAMSMGGSARAQYHLRQTFVYVNCYCLNRPEVMVPSAHELFDAEGNFTDEKTKQKVRELVEALVAWAERIKE